MEYNPPDAVLPVFNPLDYLENYQLLGGAVTGGGSSLDINYLDANYLKFPTSQGGETLIGDLTGVNGSFSGGVSATSVSAPDIITNLISTDSNYIGVQSDVYFNGRSQFSGLITLTGSNNPSIITDGASAPLYIGSNQGTLDNYPDSNPVQIRDYLFENDSSKPYPSRISNVKSSGETTYPILCDKQLRVDGTSFSTYTPVQNDNYIELSADLTKSGADLGNCITFASSNPLSPPEPANLNIYAINTYTTEPTTPENVLSIGMNGLNMKRGFIFPYGGFSGANGFMFDSGLYTTNATVTHSSPATVLTIPFNMTFDITGVLPTVFASVTTNVDTSPNTLGIALTVSDITDTQFNIQAIMQTGSSGYSTNGQYWSVSWFAWGIASYA